MNEIVLIEGRKLDLPANGIRRNLQINDVAEAKDRQANYSNTFTAPLTPGNVALMDFLGVSGNNSLKPYRKLKAQYYAGGIPLVTNGYIVVKSTFDGYEMALYDGIIDLSERIKGKKVSDLDFSDVNHYLTTQAYIDSLSNSEGFIYALGSFGYRFFGEVPIQHQAPSLFFSTIFDKIFKEAGLNYSGDFFQSNVDFLTEVLPAARGYEVAQVALVGTPLGTAELEGLRVFKNSPNPIYQEDFLQFDSEAISEMSSGLDGTLIANFTGSLELKIDLAFEVNVESYVTFRTFLNGKFINLSQLQPNQNQLSKTLNLNLTAGDELRFQVIGISDYQTEGPGGPGTGEPIDQGGTRYFLDYLVNTSITAEKKEGGQFIDFALMVPEIDQAAFIKDVMQRYGLILRANRNSDTYDFIQFEQLLNDKDNAENWTKKLDQLGAEDYSLDYAKENSAEYRYPSEASEFPFNGLMLIDNDNASPSKNFFTSPYEIAFQENAFKGSPVYSIPIWEQKTEDGVLVKTLKQTPAKIFRIKRVQNTANFRLFDEANATASSEIVFLSLEKLEMQYFINTNYKAFQSMVERTKRREASFNLSLIDIYNLDFFTLKFLEQTGKYYYLNKVQNEAGKISQSDLVQIDKFSTNLAPTILGTYTLNTVYNATRSLSLSQFTTLTLPKWFDPEFDTAAAVKITSGFNPDVLIKDKLGNVLTVETEILAEDFPISITDAGNTVNPHTAEFFFKVKDSGSGTYSAVEGKIIVNVSEYVNLAPIANAGPDDIVYMEDPLVNGEAFPTYATLDGSRSYDGTGEIVNYSWVIVSGPLNHTAVISTASSSGPVSGLQIPSNQDNVGTYYISLTVTDDLGASDSDIVEIQVALDFNKPQQL